jgi:hypothetical protein
MMDWRKINWKNQGNGDGTPRPPESVVPASLSLMILNGICLFYRNQLIEQHAKQELLSLIDNRPVSDELRFNFSLN